MKSVKERNKEQAPVVRELKKLHRKHGQLFISSANRYLNEVRKQAHIENEIKRLEAEAEEHKKTARR